MVTHCWYIGGGPRIGHSAHAVKAVWRGGRLNFTEPPYGAARLWNAVEAWRKNEELRKQAVPHL